ncbi:MAG: hypothetical protein P1U89_12945, partial [Verrucomicrobiales bacterium]|nr:hypothetical protein [Verrucomicrobiales bacterium]
MKEHSLFEQVLERENLQRAWKQVKANKGAPDIDGMTIEEFSQFIRKHWETIQTKLRDGSYRPSPVKRIYIPKPRVCLTPDIKRKVRWTGQSKRRFKKS